MRSALIDGVAPQDSARAVAIDDRGLSYGDGLFETMLLRGGRVSRLGAHLERLASGCARLGIVYPGAGLLQQEVSTVVGTDLEGVVKIIVTRGSGGRGYRPAREALPRRIVTLHDAPSQRRDEVRARWCEMRLSRNPALAGMKHLNRLENVMARQEWNDESIDEGLMLDHEGELVCGTSSNVFLVCAGELLTPDLRYCGVRGIMRAAVIHAAATLGIPVHEKPLWPDTLDAAQEVFVTNAVRGVSSIVSLEERRWSRGAVTRSICARLQAHA